LTVNSEEFCYDNFCPTGYTAAGNACGTFTTPFLAVRYQFGEIATGTAADNGMVFEQKVTVTPALVMENKIVNDAGRPAKNRGIYFDGTDKAWVSWTNIVLAPACSLHFWLMTFNEDAGNNMTVFEKQRNIAWSGGGGNELVDNQLMRLSIKAKRMTIEMASIDHVTGSENWTL
jgi:hypothetical protein